MPKQRITREIVVDAAFSLAREQGMEKVLVKELAQKLQCSVQPIYSYCSNMDDLRSAVEEKARAFADGFLRERMDPNDLLASLCRAYMAFTREEPNLAEILVFRSRKQISSPEELLHSGSGIDLYIARQLDLSQEEARQLQLDLTVYMLGLGVLFSGSGISPDLLQSRQEMAYQRFLRQAQMEHKSR